MALEALRELEKDQPHSSVSSDDDHTMSFDDLSESDSLSKKRRSDPGEGQGLLGQDTAVVQAWHDGHSTGPRNISSWVPGLPWLEQCRPASKFDDHRYVRKVKKYLPTHFIRRIRRRLGLTVPGRVLGFAALAIGGIVVVLALFGSAYFYGNGTRDGESPPVYPSPLGGTDREWRKSYKKAEKLVRQMTLAEKVNVTTGTGWMMGMCVGNTGGALEAGFPPLCLQDGPVGMRFTDHITAGPAGITVGATWNKDLMYKRGRMQGVEARRKGVNIALSPCVGPLGRMPAGGRNWEGFGSDPVLQGIAGALTTKGIQEEGVMATIKHFVGNEQEHYRQAYEWGFPDAISTTIDDRTMHELYGWPFQDAIKAGVVSVMCSYNQINNSYACQNSKLLNGMLKDELGFQGFVQSDWLAQRSGAASALAGLDLSMPGDGQHWADGKPFWGQYLTKAVLNGTIPLERLNDMVTRIVASWYQVGQDDEDKWPRPPPLGDGGPNFSSWTHEEVGRLFPGSNDKKSKGVVNKYVDATEGGGFSHSSLARAIAAEGIIMLKNEEKVLPLSRRGRPQAHKGKPMDGARKFKIAVIGEDSRGADGGPNGCPDRACNRGTLAVGWGSGSVEFPYLVTPLEALQKAFPLGDVEITSFPNNTLPSATEDSRIHEQDLCIVFVNADAGEGFKSSEGIDGDRNDLNLQHNGNALIADVAARCGLGNTRNAEHQDGSDVASQLSDTIVVIHNVGPVVVEPFIDIPTVRSVLLANLPGQESGNSLMDVLLGDVNPSGHLPYTIGKSIESYGEGAQIQFHPNGIPPQQKFSDGLLIDYRHFDSEDSHLEDASGSSVRYPFGHGLSYTTFSLRDITVNAINGQPDALPPRRPQDTASPPHYSIAIPPASEAVWPVGFRRIKKYIYPYLSESQAKHARTSDDTPASPYPPRVPQTPYHPSPAGGAQGGHPALWETVATVEATLMNDGERDGQAVVQLYVRFPQNVLESDTDLPTEQKGAEDGGDVEQQSDKIDFPVRVLRGFEKVRTYARATDETREGSADLAMQKVRFDLTRRDLSYWSVRKQNWVLPRGTFEIELGFSSRDLRGSVKLW